MCQQVRISSSSFEHTQIIGDRTTKSGRFEHRKFAHTTALNRRRHRPQTREICFPFADRELLQSWPARVIAYCVSTLTHSPGQSTNRQPLVLWTTDRRFPASTVYNESSKCNAHEHERPRHDSCGRRASAQTSTLPSEVCKAVAERLKQRPSHRPASVYKQHRYLCSDTAIHQLRRPKQSKPRASPSPECSGLV